MHIWNLGVFTEGRITSFVGINHGLNLLSLWLLVDIYSFLEKLSDLIQAKVSGIVTVVWGDWSTFSLEVIRNLSLESNTVLIVVQQTIWCLESIVIATLDLIDKIFEHWTLFGSWSSLGLARAVVVDQNDWLGHLCLRLLVALIHQIKKLAALWCHAVNLLFKWHTVHRHITPHQRWGIRNTMCLRCRQCTSLAAISLASLVDRLLELKHESIL